MSLLNLWKESVKASHHFLTESDIHNLIPDVCLALKSVEDLVVLHYKMHLQGSSVLRTKGRDVFHLPDYFGCGLGERLMDIAIRDYGCIYVDVNEQNPKARNFYRHLGFQEYERTESDAQGRPFTIIK